MMERIENLGFSLSLGSSDIPHIHRQSQLNLVPPEWTQLFASSSGIDVIRRTEVEKENHEEAGTSSPNSTLSSICGTRDHAATIDGCGGGEMITIDGCGGGEMISKDGNPCRIDGCGGGEMISKDGNPCRKKMRLSKDQSVVLEESFKEHNTLTPKEKEALAKQLNLQPRQVEVWVQNRRARTKLKKTEEDCALLKWCCENLTDENQQLREEVAKLRELKLSPQSYVNKPLPATPTMCQSCECVASSNNGAATRPANVDLPYL